MTRFFNRSTNRYKNYALLYRIMLESKSFDEEAIVKKLYGEDDAGNARLEAACDYVGRLTIAALALKDQDLHSQTSFVRKAIEKKLFRLARQVLAKALEKAWREEEFESMLLLLEEDRHLQDSGGQSARKKSNAPGRREVFERLHHLQSIETAMEAYQESKHARSSEEKEQCIAAMRAPVRGFAPESQRETAGRLQLLVRENMLLGDFAEACAHQSQLARLVQGSELPRLQRVCLAETGLHQRMLMLMGRFEESGLETMRLKSIPTKHAAEEALKLRLVLTADFCAALTLGRPRLGWEAIRKLQAEHHLLPQHKAAKLFHYAALFMAMEGRWDEVSRWSHLILSLPGKHRLPESWPPFLLLLLAAIELEDPESASTYLSRLRRCAKASAYTYPRKVALGLARLINVPANESRLLLKRFKEELRELCGDKRELVASSYFDMDSWIESRTSGITLGQVMAKQAYAPLKQFFSAQGSA